MYKYVVFCPYFGKLPSHFNLWLKSCEYNNNFKFIVFTDDCKKYVTPKNVIINKMSLDSFKSLMQERFPFTISLDSPYKLCDYKPTYGYTLNRYLENEDYWGYCDLDMIFGDLEAFIPKNKKYDKISHLGHLCLIKNNKKCNKAFMNGNCNITYKDILSNSFHFGFDEIGEYGINNIFNYNNLSIYDYEKYIADIACTKPGMATTKYLNGRFVLDEKKKLFSFQNGNIISYEIEGKNIISKKYAYIHFQKRKMIVYDENIEDQFLIIPSGFKKNGNISLHIINNYQSGRIKYYFKRIKIKKSSLYKRIKRKHVIKNILKAKENGENEK